VRTVFLGNDRWSVPSLEALASSSHPVVSVLTRVPKPAGRGNRLTPTPVAVSARALDLPVHEVETVRQGPGFGALVEAAPHVLVVVAYGEILPPPVLDVPSVAPVNLHFSLLPELRGAAPVQRALLEGLEVTGTTTIRMDPGMDTGPILLSAEEPIGEEDDAGSLGARLAVVGARLLVDTLDRLEAGTLTERPQDAAAATVAPKLRPEERTLRWNEDAESVVRRVRAFGPDPGALTTFRGRTLKVLRARAGESVHRGAGTPGRLVLLGPDRQLGALAGDDRAVVLDEVALEGRRRMSGAEFSRGQRLEADERLG
jgi:methionyl-tRNA formyltransferase